MSENANISSACQSLATHHCLSFMELHLSVRGVWLGGGELMNVMQGI